MSDNRGRGRGGSRGGGGRGGHGAEAFRGGGGRGGYSSGGYQGGSRGGGESRGGRGGGDFRGGRGRGEYRGGRGGGGDFRGGRGGGGRGGRGGYGGSGQDIFLGAGPSIPDPDVSVTELEDSWIKEHGIHSQTGVGQLKSQIASLSLGTVSMPIRPAFGTGGNPVVLWANYFNLTLKVDVLYRYDLRIISRRLTKEEDDTENKQEEAAIKKAKDKQKQASGQQSSTSKDSKEAKGRKLSQIIELAVSQLPGNPVIATEYKQQLVTMKKLELPADGHVQVELTEPGRKPETWYVRFDGPSSINTAGLKEYLRSLKDKNDGVFPKFPEEIDALGIVLGHTARSNPNTAAIGRSRFFAIDQQRKDQALKMPSDSLVEILRGYVQSVRPATGRLLLNTNVTHGVFRKEFKLDELFRSCRLINLHQPQQRPSHALRTLDSLNKFLAKMRIECKVPGEKHGEFFRIQRGMAGLATTRDGKDEKKRPEFTESGFRFGTPATVRFFFRSPKAAGATPPPGLAYDTMVLVSDYYRAKYNIHADPGLPLINVGTTGKPEYILAELCTLLPGQPLKSKLSPPEQDSMIKFACRAPPENAVSVTTSARYLLALDNNKLLDNFGITVDKHLITVKGRELPPPTIGYLKGNSMERVTPENGGWLMKGVQVCQPGRRIANWTFLVIGKAPTPVDPGDVKNAVLDFAKFLNNKMGISINTQPAPANGYQTTRTGEEELQNAFRTISKHKPQPEFVLVLLPAKEATTYHVVKKLGDVEFGVATVCVQQEMLMKKQGQAGYFANVGLKVNLKFGGVNHKVRDDTGLVERTMFVGYDVTHPTNLPRGAGDNAPSLVGLVASIDSSLAQWPAVAWENKSRVEQVGGKTDDGQFIDHFKERLRIWRHHNKRLPENIVIFRDGVSEGQFNMVLEKELPNIRQACRETYPNGQDAQPRISFIVSVKRHQTRFYPTDRDHIHPRSKSPKEGTIVDRGVTNVRYWDFFLQAHASLQGTARPAHYTVLLDEIFRHKFGPRAADVLETLTHNMCYAYGRATKAVSICPPAYYADLVAARARIHKSELFEDVQSLASSEQANVSGRKVHDNLKDTMYYI
ncbi:ribonuclease H-like domain-containing protein [Corynascus similis CBS 632.67]